MNKEATIPYEFGLLHTGGAVQLYDTGRTVVVDGDGRGYADALGFLQSFSKRYALALRSAARMVAGVVNGDTIKQALAAVMAGHEAVTAPQEVRKAVCALAAQVAACVFGVTDMQPDYDRCGDFHPEFVTCPRRALCPFNGYRNGVGSEAVCNPVYDLGVKPRDAKLAAMLSRQDTMADLAAELGVTTEAMRCRAKRLYVKLGVDDREGLRRLVAGRRVA